MNRAQVEIDLSQCGININVISFKDAFTLIYMFVFYKHSAFQSEARICLSFSQIEPQICLKYAYLRTFKRENFMI